MTLPGATAAQVLEIADGGAVTVYDRPSVFDSAGVTPIEPARRANARSVAPGQRTGTALADAARAAQLSPDLVEAVAWRESRFQSQARSPAGAIGEMQLMPATARHLGVNPYDAEQNLRGGATYLKSMLQRYDGDLVRALAAYNAGPGAVDRWRGLPPYRETREYVAAILARLSQKATSSVQTESWR